jgi:hypothetical protein
MDSTSRSLTAAVASAQLRLGRTIVTGVSITAAAADVDVTLYDNTSAAGQKVFQYSLDITTDGDGAYIALPDVLCTTGLYGVVVGAGAVVIVHFK